MIYVCLGSGVVKRLIPPIILLAMGLVFWWLQLKSTKTVSKDSASIDRKESIKPLVTSEKQQPVNASDPEPDLASKTSVSNDPKEPTQPSVASENQQPVDASEPQPNQASQTSDSNDRKESTKPSVASENQKPAISTSESELALGRWATDFGKMTIVSSRGDTGMKGTYYTKKTGQLYGSIKANMNGNTMTGYWIQEISQKKCATKKWGTHYWGRLIFVYNSEVTFTGKWGYCNELVDRNWDGEYIGTL